MSRHSTPLDGDALMRAINPNTEPASPEALEEALNRVLAEVEPAPALELRRSSPRRRYALAGGMLVAATAASFAAIAFWPGSSSTPGVDRAYARDVVARAAQVAGGGHSGVLHIDMLVTQASANHAVNARYRIESWTQLGAPHGLWETISSGSDVTTTTVIHDHVVTYDSATNTLSGATKQNGRGVSRAALFDPAYHGALAVLYPREAAVGKHLPGSFSQLIAKLIRSPHITVQRGVHLDGRRVIRISALHGRAVIYVQPATYRPLEFVTMGDPGASAQGTVRIVMRFDAYTTLPRGSVAPPNLERLHPTAKLAS
jgi:hypothetical protein